MCAAAPGRCAAATTTATVGGGSSSDSGSGSKSPSNADKDKREKRSKGKKGCCARYTQRTAAKRAKVMAVLDNMMVMALILTLVVVSLVWGFVSNAMETSEQLINADIDGGGDGYDRGSSSDDDSTSRTDSSVGLDDSSVGFEEIRSKVSSLLQPKTFDALPPRVKTKANILAEEFLRELKSQVRFFLNANRFDENPLDPDGVEYIGFDAERDSIEQVETAIRLFPDLLTRRRVQSMPHGHRPYPIEKQFCATVTQFEHLEGIQKPSQAENNRLPSYPIERPFCTTVIQFEHLGGTQKPSQAENNHLPSYPIEIGRAHV